MTNDDDTFDLEFPRFAEFFYTVKTAYSEHWDIPPLYMAKPNSESGKYLRGAIQLRPALEQLSENLGDRDLTGEDIVAFATSSRPVQDDAILEWTEDWNHSRSCSEGNVYRTFLQADVIYGRKAEDLCSVYKEWLQDPVLAEQVAKAFNKGVKEHDEVAYPFVHSEYPGKGLL